MKKIIFLVIVVIAIGFISIKSMNNKNTNNEAGENLSQVSITPINHASLILAWSGVNIYADPVDEKKANIFEDKAPADIILVTDIHGDHMDLDTLKKITQNSTTIIAPQAVAEKIPEELKGKVSVLNNGEKGDFLGFSIEAIPAYNLPGPSENYHTKGRGNGYVIDRDGVRVYISGDTAGIPEMRELKDIDIAFVAMNLPYTMPPEEAASAVLDFKPKTVYPYHYRQNPTKDFADVSKFKEIVNTSDQNIKVELVNWYSE